MKFLLKKPESVEITDILKRRYTIKLTREEYEGLKKVFCMGKGWQYNKKDKTINLRQLVIFGNYKWHPGDGMRFDIEVEKEMKKGKSIKIKGDLHIGQGMQKPYISIPGDKI